MRRALRFVTLAVSGGFTLACGGAMNEQLAEELTEKALEAGTGTQDVELGDQGMVQVTGADGSVVNVGAGATMPDAWPKEVPTYPGASVTLSACSGTAGQPGHSCMVSLETADGPEKVFEYYKGNVSGGWTKEAEATYGGSYTLSFRNGGRLLAVNAMGDGAGRTTVQLAIADQ